MRLDAPLGMTDLVVELSVIVGASRTLTSTLRSRRLFLQEPGHQVTALLEDKARRCGADVVVGRCRVGIDARSAGSDRHVAMSVSFRPQKRWMVW